jgi:DNA polymerase-3 subunit beta
MADFNRKDLLKTLNLLKGSLSDKDYIPVYTCFCFDSEDGNIYAYNDVMASIFDFDLDELDEPIAIPGKILLSILNGLSGEMVSFNIDKDILRIKSGKSKFNIPIFSEDDFIFKIPELKNTIDIDITDDFMKGISACLISIGDDAIHSNHKGISFVVDDSDVFLYSTDNTSISKYTVSDMDVPDEDLSLLIPKEFCIEMISIYKNDQDAEYTFSIGKGFIAILKGDFICLYSKFEDDHTEDFESIFDKYKKEIKGKGLGINNTFFESLKRSLLMLDGETIKKAQCIVKGNKVELLTESKNGNLQDLIPFDGKSKNKVGFYLPVDIVLRACDQLNTVMFLDDVILFKKSNKFLHLIAHCSN